MNAIATGANWLGWILRQSDRSYLQDGDQYSQVNNVCKMPFLKTFRKHLTNSGALNHTHQKKTCSPVINTNRNIAIMKLRTKLVHLPLMILVIVFVLMISVFLVLSLFYSSRSKRKEYERLLSAELQQIYSGLSIVMASTLPEDAFLGLEEGDTVLAEEVFAQIRALRVSNAYFTDLSGKNLYPDNENFPRMFPSIIQGNSQAESRIHVAIFENSLIGYGKIIDIDEPKGYLLCQVEIPQRLRKAAAAMPAENASSTFQTITEDLENGERGIEQRMAGFIKKQIVFGVLGFVLSLLVIALSFKSVAESMTQRVGMLNERLRDIVRGEGNLTQRLPVVSDDELDEAAVQFNLFMECLETLVSKIAAMSSRVKDAAGDLSQWMKALIEAREDQTQKTVALLQEQMDRVINHVASQTTATEQTSLAVAEISTTIRMVTSHASSTMALSETAAHEARQGGKFADDSSNHIYRIEEIVRNVEAQILELGKSSQAIDTILNEIEGITDQTKMLSLNATIEAVRIGEAGVGFKVVADEVKVLAKRTEVAAQGIQRLIGAIRKDLLQVTETSKVAYSEVRSGVSFAEQAARKLSTIVETAEKTHDEIANISDSMEKIAASVPGIEISMSDIARNSTEIEKLSLEEAGILTEIVSVLRHVVIAADELSEVSHGLDDAVSQFHIHQ